MKSPELGIELSEREQAELQRIANERGISLEEATSQLVSEHLASRFRRHLGRAPATVYPMPRKRP